MEIRTKDLSAVSTGELLKRLEYCDGVNDTYRAIVKELNSRGVPAEVPPSE